MKLLKPLRLKDAWYSDIEEQLRVIFFEELIKPISRIIREHTSLKVVVENAYSEVRKALESGRIQYEKGRFIGKFSSRISKQLRELGAVFRRSDGSYRIGLYELPAGLISAITEAQAKAVLLHQLINDELQRRVQKFEEARYDVDASKVVRGVDKGWREAASKLFVLPELTDERKKELASDYTQNMALWIKDWQKKEIVKLRQEVQENAEQGYRYESLIKRIEQRGHVSHDHAKFLARQETSLFMSKFQEQRYKQIGVLTYRWSTAMDERVRPAPGHSPKYGDHRALQGRVFSWDKPPDAKYFSDRQPCHPGEDYNCRCVAIPIVGTQ